MWIVEGGRHSILVMDTNGRDANALLGSGSIDNIGGPVRTDVSRQAWQPTLLKIEIENNDQER